LDNTSSVKESVSLYNNYQKFNQMRRCKSDNICILLHDEMLKEKNEKTLQRSYSAPNLIFEFNDSHMYSKNKDGEDSRSTINSNHYYLNNSFYDKKKKGSVLLSSFQSKLNSLSYMLTKTSNNIRIFSKNIDSSINKLTSSKEKVDNIDFNNKDVIGIHSDHSLGKNSVHSEYNNRTKFKFKPRNRHRDKFANRSNKSNLQLRDNGNESHNLTKMNIFSKNKDNGFGGDVKKSSSFSRLRQATNKSIRSFRSARAYNKDVDRSLKMLNSIDSETKSGEERNNEDSISELFEENQNSKSNKKESTENVNEKEHPHDKLLHSKQGSVISKNHSIKSKIKKISKISSLKKKGKNLYNELSKEFKITNHVDDIISSTQPNSNKLSSTDSFSDWFNSISSTPPIQSQASSSNVSTPMQSPLINEIVFSSPEPIVKNKNNRKWKGSSSPPKDNNSTEYLSTSSSSPSSLPPNDLSNTNNGEQLSVTINNNENLSKGIQENSDLKSNNKNLATIDPMNIPLVFSKDRLNSKIAPGREITVSKQLPPLPVGLRYIGEIVNYYFFLKNKTFI